MKEPTMTEIEREAEARAKAAKILETSGVGKLLDMGPWEDLIDSISEALLSASRPPAGFVRDAEGVDRRVLGTLPVTADGVVVLPGSKVWPRADLFVCNVPENTDWTVEEEAGVVALSLRAECDIEDWDVTKCYSTPEAARTAAEAAAGKERG